MRRSAFVVVPFLAVPLAAAACGGGKSASSTKAALPDDPLAAVKGAARKTSQSGSEHVKLSGHVVTSGQTVTFTGGGDFDAETHLGAMKVDVSVGGINTTIDEVSQGTIVYLKSELLGAMLPAGKTWVKLDLAKSAKSAGVDVSSFLSQDPTQPLAQLQGLRDVKKVGTAQIDGAAMTHYRARIDLSKLKAGATAGRGRYDVWIGDDGYVHRVKAIVTATGATSTVTSDLSAFGDDVNVTVPSARETFDGSNSMIPGLGG
jgi:hypothetical protein